MFHFIYKVLTFGQEFRKLLSQMYTGPHVKYPLFLPYISIKLEFFSTDFQKILKHQISRKSVLWELSCSMPTDGQRDGQQTDTINPSSTKLYLSDLRDPFRNTQ